MKDKVWYAEGLRFQCLECGRCCTGEPGYVWVTRQELAAMAKLLGEADLERFVSEVSRRVGARRSLNERPNGDCIFWEPRSRRCRVYAARPRQCRTWPFWPSNLRTPASWAATCRQCPGAGRGRLYRLEEIQRRRETVRV